MDQGPNNSAPSEGPAAETSAPPPREGDWYAPQGADDSPGVDYFRDDRRLISRIFSLAMLVPIIALAVMVTGMWYAAPAIHRQLNAAPERPPATMPATRPSPHGAALHQSFTPKTAR